MLDFSAYLAAQHLTREAAHDALPHAPVRPDRVTTGRGPGVAARHWLSVTLRHLATVIAWEPERASSTMPGG
jgi:hypothetical protein